MKKKVTLISIAAVLVLLAVWRLAPRSVYTMTGLEEGRVQYATLHLQQEVLTDGTISMDSWKLSLSPEDDRLADVLTLLEDSGYRPGLINLLPGGQGSVSTGDFDGRRIFIILRGDSIEETVSFELMSPSTLALSLNHTNGMHTFHPTNRALLDKLCAYVQANGTPGN